MRTRAMRKKKGDANFASPRWLQEELSNNLRLALKMHGTKDSEYIRNSDANLCDSSPKKLCA